MNLQLKLSTLHSENVRLYFVVHNGINNYQKYMSKKMNLLKFIRTTKLLVLD